MPKTLKKECVILTFKDILLHKHSYNQQSQEINMEHFPSNLRPHLSFSKCSSETVPATGLCPQSQAAFLCHVSLVLVRESPSFFPCLSRP